MLERTVPPSHRPERFDGTGRSFCRSQLPGAVWASRLTPTTPPSGSCRTTLSWPSRASSSGCPASASRSSPSASTSRHRVDHDGPDSWQSTRVRHRTTDDRGRTCLVYRVRSSREWLRGLKRIIIWSESSRCAEGPFREWLACLISSRSNPKGGLPTGYRIGIHVPSSCAGTPPRGHSRRRFRRDRGGVRSDHWCLEGLLERLLERLAGQR